LPSLSGGGFGRSLSKISSSGVPPPSPPAEKATAQNHAPKEKAPLHGGLRAISLPDSLCPALLCGFADSIGNRKCVSKRQPRAHVLALAPYLQRDAFGIGAIHAHCRRFLVTYVGPVVRIIFQSDAETGHRSTLCLDKGRKTRTRPRGKLLRGSGTSKEGLIGAEGSAKATRGARQRFLTERPARTARKASAPGSDWFKMKNADAPAATREEEE
jgi:hypothetical protein